MTESLKIIQAVIEAHRRIRQDIDSLKQKAMVDREALDSLQNARAQWIPGLPDVAEKQQKLRQTLNLVCEGLKRHFQWEEKVLPEVLEKQGGELFMRILIIEHGEINRKIAQTMSAVAEVKLEGLNREKLLTKQSDIQQIIGSMSQLVDEHVTREEIIFEMVERVLKEGVENKNPQE